MQRQLAQLRVFLVGAGALGCEFLKNFAMMGVSTSSGGQVCNHASTCVTQASGWAVVLTITCVSLGQKVHSICGASLVMLHKCAGWQLG